MEPLIPPKLIFKSNQSDPVNGHGVRNSESLHLVRIFSKLLLSMSIHKHNQWPESESDQGIVLEAILAIEQSLALSSPSSVRIYMNNANGT